MKNEEHNWTKDDMILALYYTLYGLDTLEFDEYEYAEIRIGASVNSLRMQSANIRQYYKDMGYDRRFDSDYLLSDHYGMQRKVVDEYKDIHQSKLLDIVGGILIRLEPNIKSNTILAEKRKERKNYKKGIEKEILRLEKELDKSKKNLQNQKNMRLPASLIELGERKIKESEKEVSKAEINLFEYIKSVKQENNN